MTAVSSVRTRPRVLSARRLVLLATVASLGLGTLVIDLDRLPESLAPTISTALAAEQTSTRPIGFAELVAKVKPAVISVRATGHSEAKLTGFEGNTPFPPNSQIERFFRRFGMPDARLSDALRNQMMREQGSGFFITSDGYAVTNNHIVGSAGTVEVTTDDGKTYAAKVIGTDGRSDLALIKVDGRGDFPYVTFADNPPRIGDWVVTVGNPFGLGGTVTAGIVSARGRDIGAGSYDDLIQIDAPVNKGNSGGPTFDMDGKVIGVNTAIFSPSGGSVGIAFDVPAETVKGVVAQLKDKGAVSRGWLGVQIQPISGAIAESLGMKGSDGALVAEPQAGSPAAKAGILAGDVITAVNGNSVKDARDLAKRIGAMAPGATVQLAVWRKGEEKSFSLTLGELPKERQVRAASPDTGREEVPKLGLMLAPAAQVAGGGTEGVIVTRVEPNGLAFEHGFKTGDVILDVGGKKVASPIDVRNALGEAYKDGKRSVLMRVKSDETTKFVAIPITRA